MVKNKQKIDDLDTKILNSLILNAKQSYRKLAKSLHVSVGTIMKRVRELENKGIIKGYSTKIDYEKLGYDFKVIVEVRVSKGKLFEAENKISLSKEVFGVYDQTGAFDATLIARFKNRRSLDEFIKKLQKLEYVERTETKFILNTIKEENQKLI